MNPKQLFDALGGIDDDLFAEIPKSSAPTAPRRWTRAFVPMAACLVVVVAAALYSPGHLPPAPPTPPDSSSLTALPPAPAPSPTADGNPGCLLTGRPPVGLQPGGELATQESLHLFPNPVEAISPTPASSGPCLRTEDFVPMTREELLDYYAVELPIPSTLPQLHPAAPSPEQPQGLYRRDGRIYSDANTFRFEGAGGAWLTVGLSKAISPPSAPRALKERELQLTSVNGRELAVFSFATEASSTCYYAEWLQEGISWYLTAEGLSDQDYLQALSALVKPSKHVKENTLTGELSYGVCTLTDHEQVTEQFVTDITVKGADGTWIHVLLPQKLAPEALQGCSRATVAWRGEPATIRTVWAEQLISFTPLKGKMP